MFAVVKFLFISFGIRLLFATATAKSYRLSFANRCCRKIVSNPYMSMLAWSWYSQLSLKRPTLVQEKVVAEEK